MVKVHAKPVRNTINATQERSEHNGAFVRRHDDGDVRVSISRAAMFAEANSAAKARSAMDRLSRQSRNSSARINANRGYDPNAIAASPPVRKERALASDMPAVAATPAKAHAGRIFKPRSLAPLSQMAFSGARPLHAHRRFYPWA